MLQPQFGPKKVFCKTKRFTLVQWCSMHFGTVFSQIGSFPSDKRILFSIKIVSPTTKSIVTRHPSNQTAGVNHRLVGFACLGLGLWGSLRSLNLCAWSEWHPTTESLELDTRDWFLGRVDGGVFVDDFLLPPFPGEPAGYQLVFFSFPLFFLGGGNIFLKKNIAAQQNAEII